MWSQMYFVFVKVTKRKRRSLGVAPVPLQIAVHRPLRLLQTALLIPLLPLLQSWVRTDQGLPVSISPLFSGYVDEIVWSDRTNETYLAKPSSGTISFTVFYKLAFWMLFHLFPISFMFPVLKRFFELSGFFQQNQRSAQQVQVKKVPQAKREVQQAKNLVYPRHLPREGQEEAQEQAPQHRPVVRKALRESLKKLWEGTSQESPWPARTFCKSSRANERACQMMRPWKSLLLLLERYNPNRRPSKGNYICRLNRRAKMCAREGLLFRPILA